MPSPACASDVPTDTESARLSALVAARDVLPPGQARAHVEAAIAALRAKPTKGAAAG
jgi:hypothetical protein